MKNLFRFRRAKPAPEPVPRRYHVVYEAWSNGSSETRSHEYRLRRKGSALVTHEDAGDEADDMAATTKTLRIEHRFYDDLVITHWKKLNND